MEPIKLKLISYEDIVKGKVIDIFETISVIEQAFKDFQNGKVLLPGKVSQVFNEEEQNRINCMPSTLLDKKICGMKWVSIFPNNPLRYKSPNISGIIVLSEIEKGYPFAVIEASIITALRTACVGAVASKYLAKKSSKTYCTIGTGEQARMHFRAIKTVHPEISICRVSSRNRESVERFINHFKEKFPEVNFINCGDDYESAPRGADIIVTAVSCQAPLLKANSITKGAFYCHVGGWEDEYDVPLKANKIVCDHWESVKHRTQTISRLYKEKKLLDEDIYADIGDIICEKKQGRENDEEFIYFNSVGLGYIDIAVAYNLYKKLENSGFSKEWIMQEKIIKDYFDEKN